MDDSAAGLYISRMPTTTVAAAPLLVSYSEVRHSGPPDLLHYEPISVRGKMFDWTVPLHRHEGLHQVQLFTRGAGAVTIDGRESAIGAPTVVLVPPGAVHGARHEPGTDGHQLTLPSAQLSAAFAGMPRLLERLSRAQVLQADALGPVDEPLRLFEAIADEFRGQRSGRAQALTWHANLLVLWLLRRGEPADALAAASHVDERLAHAFRTLADAHYREHRPLAFYAERLGVSTSHLGRACQSVFGGPPLRLLHELLCGDARRLLAFTPATIAQVAETLGFDDPAYFTRFFSRVAGESPTAFRAGFAAGRRHAGPPPRTAPPDA